MATLISLVEAYNGIQSLDSNLRNFKKSIEAAGGTCEYYITMGSYDAVVITKGMRRGDLARAGAANLQGVRSNTLSGYDDGEVAAQLSD